MEQTLDFFNNYSLERILGNSLQEQHREEQQQEQQLQNSGKQLVGLKDKNIY